ncbi:MAG: 3-oxoadipate enol-lactonase [Pseudomonadota bacterium]
MPELEIDGRRLRYEFSGPGDAPVLTFANSLGTTLEMWAPQAAALGDRYRLLRFDARGHGGSDLGDAAPVESFADDVLSLLDHLGIAQTHFCGLSLGGLTGQALAIAAPDRLLSLTLANTAVQIPGDALWNGRIAAVRAGGLESIAEAVLARWLTPDAPPELRTHLEEMLCSIEREGYARACIAVRDADFRDRAPAIAAPTLVISGDGDTATPPEMSETLAGLIPGARHVMLKGAGHISNLEQAAAFTDALRAHLDRHPEG